MKAKKILLCLFFDLRRSVCNIGFVSKVLLISFVILISQSDIIKDFFVYSNIEGYDVIGLYNLMVHYDTFKLLLLLVLTSVYANSICIERNNHVFQYIVFRTGTKEYVFSKVITTLIASSLAYIAGLSIAFFALSRIIPLSEAVSPVVGDANYMSFAFLTPHEHPYIWMTLTALLFLSSINVFCILGLVSSLYIKDIMIVQCIPSISYFMLTSLTYFLPEIFYLPAYGNQVTLISENPWINYFYKLVMNIVVTMLLAYILHSELRKQCDEGNY